MECVACARCTSGRRHFTSYLIHTIPWMATPPSGLNSRTCTRGWPRRPAAAPPAPPAAGRSRRLQPRPRAHTGLDTHTNKHTSTPGCVSGYAHQQQTGKNTNTKCQMPNATRPSEGWNGGAQRVGSCSGCINIRVQALQAPQPHPDAPWLMPPPAVNRPPPSPPDGEVYPPASSDMLLRGAEDRAGKKRKRC